MTTETDQTAPPQLRLRHRILSAGAWALGAYGGTLSVRFLSNLILTRLLFPEAFGAIAAAMAMIAGLVLITDFGVQAAVVQSPRGDQAAFLRSAWVFQLWRGFTVWLVLAGFCALISTSAIRDVLPSTSIFADRTLPLLTAILGFNVVLSSAESTSMYLSIRHLNYKPVVLIDLAGKILSVPIIIAWAWIAPSVWALVGGILAAGVARLILSHVWVPGPRMNLNWEREHFQEIFVFGKWIVVSSVASFLASSAT